MRTTPGPGRVLVRGLLWAPLLGGLAGGGVWLLVCLATLALPAVVLTPVAVVVGAVVGLVPGAFGAGVVALVARRGPVRPAVGAAVAATAAAGVAFDLALLGVGADTGTGGRLVWWLVLTVLFAGGGAVGGCLVAQPRWVSARPNGAAAATGTAFPGWSPAPGR